MFVRRCLAVWMVLVLVVGVMTVTVPAGRSDEAKAPAVQKSDAPPPETPPAAAKADTAKKPQEKSKKAATPKSEAQKPKPKAETKPAPAKKPEPPKEPAKKPEPAKQPEAKPQAEPKPEEKKPEPPKEAKPEAKPQAEPKPEQKPSLFSKLLKQAAAKAGAEEKPAEAKPAEPAKGQAKEAESKKPEAKKPVKRVTVVQVTLRGSYPEGPTTIGPFGEMETSLASLLTKFEQLAADKDVAAVLLEIETDSLGGGKVHEIRQAIGRLRKAGKPVYAMLTAVEGGPYLIACACDEIVMAPPGILVIPGVRAEVMFYKGLLDKLGVKADMLQMGKYKGAGEPFTRTGMSPALRESFEAIVEDTYERFVAEVAKDRKRADYQVKGLIDQGLFTAADAKKAGLVDCVAYADQFLIKLKKRLGADELALVTKYKSAARSTDFSGVSGMMKLLQVMLGGKPTAATSSNKKVAVIYAVGPIMQGKSGSSLFGDTVVGSTTMVEAFRQAEKDATVQAIVLRVDSPGGSAIASDLIWREMVRIKKPIIASMGDVAGSGGYYISVGADAIYAEPSTLTGSIGVIGGKFALGGLYAKIGLSTDVISRGKNSGLLSSDKPFTPSEREVWRASMEEIYRQFVTKSAQGRKMSYEKLDELAQGRIYTGNMAVANGLVDRLGTLADAVAEAKKRAGLKPDEKVELLILPRPKSIFEQLFGDPSAMADAEDTLAQLVKPLAQAQTLRRLFSERVLTMMPFYVEMR